MHSNESPDGIVVSGTGARDLANAPTDHQFKVSRLIREELTILQPSRVIAGGAEGFDHLLALVAFSLDIPVTLAVPSPSYGEYYWALHSVTGFDRTEEWIDMLTHAEEAFHISSWHMNGRANFIRNQWMVDAAEIFLVYKPTSRGTSDCVRRIKAAGKMYQEIEVLCSRCNTPLHYNGANPTCERCAGELCDNCFEAEENTWD